MIIKGVSRKGSQELGVYLSTPGENEDVKTLEVRGTVARDVRGALAEMGAYAVGTKCEKHLYHAQINPEPPNRLSPDQCMQAVDALEARLGLDGHTRVVVMHEKHGRQHLHVAWSRIDVNTMKAVHMSHSYRHHEEAARDLERLFGHDRVQGVHHERDGRPRPGRSPTRSELRQEEKTGIRGKEVREEITEIFKNSKKAEDFRTVIEGRGYILANGDRRDFVIVDARGGIHSLARRIEGVNAKQLREFMKAIDPKTVPSVKEAKAIQQERASEMFRDGGLDWEDKLRIEGAKKLDADRDSEKLKKRKKREARGSSRQENEYAEGQDYVTQTDAANKHHKKRRPKDEPRPQHPKDHVSPKIEKTFRDAAGNVTSEKEAPDPHAKRKARKDAQKLVEGMIEKFKRLREGRAQANKPKPRKQSIRDDVPVGKQDIRFRDEASRPKDHSRAVPQLSERDLEKAIEAKEADARKKKIIAATKEDAHIKRDERFRDAAVRPQDYGRHVPQLTSYDEKRAKAAEEAKAAKPKTVDRPVGGKDRRFRDVEISDREAEREQRRLAEEKWSDRDPDDHENSRQRKAPGRGRTRSR